MSNRQDNYLNLVKKISELNKIINWKLWSGLLISALFLYLAFRKVDLVQTWTMIRSANLFILYFVILLTFFQFVIRAWRWKILLEPIQKTGFSNRLSSTLIGFAANCIFPARLGEFIRANYLGHSENISAGSAFGTIVVERLFDGYTLLLVLLIGLIGTTFPSEWHFISTSLRGAGFLLLFLYSLLIIFLVGVRYKATPFLKLLERLLFFLPTPFLNKIINTVRNFSMGLVLSRNPYRLIQVVFYSFFLWFTSLYQIQLIEQALGLSLPFIACFLILSMATFGVIIPSAPGFIGTFHLSVQYGFMFYGIGREEALSAAIVWHSTLFLSTIIFGFVSILFIHIPFGRLRKEAIVLKKGPAKTN